MQFLMRHHFLKKPINVLQYCLFLLASVFLNQTVSADQSRLKSYKDLDTKALQHFLKKHKDAVLIDVRMENEVAVEGTIDAGFRNYNISRGWLEISVADSVPKKDTPIVMICNTASRSPFAAETMVKLGYTNVHNYKDGFYKWRDAKLPVSTSDQYVGSLLYRKPEKVADGIWSAIGATAPPTFENSGHNNNLSFIITKEGVVVVNAGGSYLLAQALHNEIKQLTKQPVKFVILENGQGHAMLGSNYWQEQGAKIIAHDDAAHEIESHGYEEIDRMRLRQRDKAMSTVLSKPDITFSDKHVIELGGERIEAINLGPAHSPGDIVVWLPKKKIVISGDMAFHQRLLPVFEHTDTAGWIETWDKFAALGAKKVVPGHGGITTMGEVEKYTVGYLQHMREAIAAVLDDGGMLEDAYQVDQSPYSHLDTYDELAKQNAGRIFRAMEFE